MLVLAVIALFASLAGVQADYAPSPCTESNLMTMITDSAAWPGRAEAGGAYMSQPFTFTPSGSSTPVTWPAGTISIFGGKSAFNDVWISSDSAESWTLLSGVSNYVNGAYTASKLADGGRTAVCQKAGSDEVWLVGGKYSSVKTSRVQRGNLKEWTVVTTAAAFPGRERPACLVDSDNNVYVFGGNLETTSASVNDIWSSVGGTAAWTRITATAAWGIREGQGMVVMKTNDRLMSATGEIMVMAYGLMYNTDNNQRMNDVWVSRDRARSWQRVNAGAFPSRQDANIAVSDANVLVVAGGDCGDECNLNDIWASLDGGQYATLNQSISIRRIINHSDITINQFVCSHFLVLVLF